MNPPNEPVSELELEEWAKFYKKPTTGTIPRLIAAVREARRLNSEAMEVMKQQEDALHKLAEIRAVVTEQNEGPLWADTDSCSHARMLQDALATLHEVIGD